MTRIASIQSHQLPGKSVLLICLLLLITALAIITFDFMLVKKLTIDKDNGYTAKAVDDSAQGGDTTSRILESANGQQLDCDLRSRFAWPYCELAIEIGKNGTGINIGDYDSIKLDLDYQSDTGNAIRVYLRNFNPAYIPSKPAESLKVNQIEYDPRNYPTGLQISLHYFQVATWWLNDHHIPLQLSQPELNNITQIEIATGGDAKPGHHRITLRSIEFQGRWISRTVLYGMLIAMWTASALAFLSYRVLIHLRNENDLKVLARTLVLEGETYRTMARTDMLTGALNRNGAIDQLFKHASHSVNSGKPFSLIFFDLDHFKQINDQFGHSTGDEVLKELVQLVRSQIRNSDEIIRWGGEEFLLALPGASGEQGMQLAEKLRQAILKHPWPACAQLSSSFGVAEFGEEKLMDCIARADNALYEAKNGGRNCVKFAHTAQSTG